MSNKKPYSWRNLHWSCNARSVRALQDLALENLEAVTLTGTVWKFTPAWSSNRARKWLLSKTSSSVHFVTITSTEYSDDMSFKERPSLCAKLNNAFGFPQNGIAISILYRLWLRRNGDISREPCLEESLPVVLGQPGKPMKNWSIKLNQNPTKQNTMWSKVTRCRRLRVSAFFLMRGFMTPKSCDERYKVGGMILVALLWYV